MKHLLNSLELSIGLDNAKKFLDFIKDYIPSPEHVESFELESYNDNDFYLKFDQDFCSRFNNIGVFDLRFPVDTYIDIKVSGGGFKLRFDLYLWEEYPENYLKGSMTGTKYVDDVYSEIDPVEISYTYNGMTDR